MSELGPPPPVCSCRRYIPDPECPLHTKVWCVVVHRDGQLHEAVALLMGEGDDEPEWVCAAHARALANQGFDVQAGLWQ